MASDSSTDLDLALHIQRRARHNILGELVASLDASGFLTPQEPQALLEILQSIEPQILIDLGCGNGRMGVWLASAASCGCYHGIDIDPPSTSRFNSTMQVSFAKQNFDTLKLERSGLKQVVLSHDALYLAANPPDLLKRITSGLGEHFDLVTTLYVGSGVWEGGIEGRSLSDWVDYMETAGFSPLHIEDITVEWRFWAKRFHIERLQLCEQVERGGDAVEKLAYISRRMLGLDGRHSFLEAVSRFRIHAIARPPS